MLKAELDTRDFRCVESGLQHSLFLRHSFTSEYYSRGQQARRRNDSEETMADITAKLVNDLRAKTGQGMMECKKALQESGGDLEKALDYFKKKGVKSSLTERAATEGRVVGVAAEDGKAASLVEVNCN